MSWVEVKVKLVLDCECCTSQVVELCRGFEVGRSHSEVGIGL